MSTTDRSSNGSRRRAARRPAVPAVPPSRRRPVPLPQDGRRGSAATHPVVSVERPPAPLEGTPQPSSDRDSYSATALAEINDRWLHALMARYTAGLSPMMLV